LLFRLAAEYTLIRISEEVWVSYPPFVAVNLTRYTPRCVVLNDCLVPQAAVVEYPSTISEHAEFDMLTPPVW
jgi:hypothetical protein